jgi:Beta-propeller repeat
VKSSVLRAVCRFLPLGALCLFAAAAVAGGSPAAGIDAGTARTLLGRAPATFVENVGQIPGSAAFYVPGADKQVLLGRNGVTFVLDGRRATPSPLRSVSLPSTSALPAVVRLEFVGARADVAPVGEAVTGTAFSYFRGDAAQWKTGLRSFARVIYPDLWPGIDLVYRGTREGIKYSFVVRPGADPARIRLAYAGADSIAIDDAGGLAVATSGGDFGDAAPASFQGSGESTTSVATAFVLRTRQADRTEFGFELGAYDASRELVIDPAVNVIVGFLGAGGTDELNAVAVDTSGNIYVAGDTLSTSALSTGGVVQPALKGATDAFVAKLSPAGAVLYVTYLGGSNDDVANGVAADGAGNAYVTGYTHSADFPTDGTPGDGHFSRVHSADNGGSDVFVTKLNANGTALVYSGFLGGSNDDVGHAIALDSSGAAYVTGETNSTTCTSSDFPVTVGPVLNYTPTALPSAFCTDAFVGKIKADGSGVDYLGFIGGSGGVEIGHGIAVNAATGEAYVAGETDSPVGGGFPHTSGSFGDIASGPGIAHAFLVKVKADGSGFLYAGVLPTNNQDRAFAAAIDPSGNAYIAGDTQSTNLATPGVAQGANGGAGDPFAAAVNAAGSAIVYATYLGGPAADAGKSIVVDATGNAVVTGYTQALLNTVATPGLDTTPNGANDAFLVKLNATGTAETFAGYLGGASGDSGNGLAMDGSGKLFLAGNTYSVGGTSPNFPATGVPASGIFSSTYHGSGDGFVAVIGKFGLATHFSVTASPLSVGAGGSVNVVVTALDSSDTVVQDYVGTVHFTSSDGLATLPADYTFVAGDAGIHTFASGATLRTAGAQTVTATDIANGSPTGTSNVVAVTAGPATHFVVSAPAGATAGTAFNFTVTALDSFNNIATGYAGTVHVTSSDGDAVLPADGTLTNGIGTLAATLKTAGTQTLTATDTVVAGITGTSGNIIVSAGAATQFIVAAPPAAVAGNAFNFTVTAKDAFNNTATGYAGIVHFTSSDGAAVLPADSVLASGAGTFSATLKTAGVQTITAIDTVASSVTGTSGNIVVGAGAATHFAVTAPAAAAAGVAFNFTVTALDAFNNTATGYGGAVHFTASDGAATLPADAPLANGTGTFNATLRTAGVQTLSAVDTVNGSITGTSNAIAVTAGAATHFAISAPASVTAGVPFNFTVTALDAFNNVATSFGDVVRFTDTDAAANLPGNAPLINGIGTFSATLKTVGVQTVTATDTGAPIAGTSSSITVTAAAATHFVVSAPAAATAGAAFNFTVTALDAFNNTATGYTGTVHFTSTDGAAILPADATLASGVGTFSATLKTQGTQTISAVDTVTSSISGVSNGIVVGTATATHFLVSAPANATAGTAFSLTVTAQDQFNNTVTTYAGTVHFTSTDAAAVLPANATLASGVGTFSATLKTSGNQTLTATDTVTASITGTSGAIAVGAGAATHFTVTAPAGVTAGTAFNFTVTAQDALNNTATNYSGTVHFTSTDGAGILPANSTLSGGAGTFSATLKTVGARTITATDTVTASITGTSGTIVVAAGAPVTITATAGTPQSAIVRATYAAALQATVQDGSGNPVAGVGVTFAAPGPGASVAPVSATVNTDVNGVATAPSFTANGVVGSFNVTATVAGIATPANFALTNSPQLVYSGITATGTGIATATLSGGGPTCTFATAAFVGLPSAALPGILFPDGLFDFTATGCVGAITMSIVFPTASGAQTHYWKYGPVPPGPLPKPSQWYMLGAANSLLLSGHTDAFTIVDGGLGDDDLAVNGTIVDQGGPGIPLVVSGQPIPTLGSPAYALLIVLLLLGAIAFRRRSAR